MRMLRRIYRHIKSDKTRNEDICDKVVLASMVDKIEVSLRWLGHVKWRCIYAPIRRY